LHSRVHQLDEGVQESLGGKCIRRAANRGTFGTAFSRRLMKGKDFA